MLLFSLMLSVAIATADDPGGDADPVAEYVRRFLDETLIEARFAKPHHMEYHVDVGFPDWKPEVYSVGAKYAHWVSPPLYRIEAEIGPFEPTKQAAIRSVMLWNGTSQISLRHDPTGRQSSAVVDRELQPKNSAKCNKLWAELGIPTSDEECEEARRGSYWLRGTVTSANGYSLSPDLEIVGGAKCAVIRKGNEDCLWFSVDGPTRLIKRDCWRMGRSPARQVLEMNDYREDGLPAKIVHTHYFASDQIGEPSRIRGVETVQLDLVEFAEPPKEKSIVNIEDGVAVFDVKSLSSFHTEKPGAPPFDKLLRQSPVVTVQASASGRGWLIDINIFVLAIVALVLSYQRFIRQA